MLDHALPRPLSSVAEDGVGRRISRVEIEGKIASRRTFEPLIARPVQRPASVTLLGTCVGSSSVAACREGPRRAFAAKDDQFLRAPELVKAAGVARYLDRYVGRGCGEPKVCDRVLHRFH